MAVRVVLGGKQVGDTRWAEQTSALTQHRRGRDERVPALTTGDSPSRVVLAVIGVPSTTLTAMFPEDI